MNTTTTYLRGSQEYRKAKKIHLTLEHKLMTQMTGGLLSSTDPQLALVNQVRVGACWGGVERRPSALWLSSKCFHRFPVFPADYDNLALMQKVEVFEYALENTDGQDLNRVWALALCTSCFCHSTRQLSSVVKCHLRCRILASSVEKGIVGQRVGIVLVTPQFGATSAPHRHRCCG